MTEQTAHPAWGRLVPLLVVGASVGALALAYTAEYAFGLEPCALCLYQRVPYAAAALAGGAALALPAQGRTRAAAVAASGVLFLAGGGLAIYHVGVEQHWWASVAACGGDLPAEMSLDEFKARLSAPPPKPCDEVDWSLFGISLAGYNAIASLALAVASLAGARLMRERRAA